MINETPKSVCRVCGGYTASGTVECPRCAEVQKTRERAQFGRASLRPVWNNASRSGPAIGYRVVGGPYNGVMMREAEA